MVKQDRLNRVATLEKRNIAQLEHTDDMSLGLESDTEESFAFDSLCETQEPDTRRSSVYQAP